MYTFEGNLRFLCGIDFRESKRGSKNTAEEAITLLNVALTRVVAVDRESN